MHGAREARNVSLPQYEPLMVVVAAMATCFLLTIATSAVNSAVLVPSDDGTSQSLFVQTVRNASHLLFSLGNIFLIAGFTVLY